MDLYRITLSTKALQDAQNPTKPLQQNPEETILPSSQGMPVAKFLSRARRVPIVYFFCFGIGPLDKSFATSSWAAC
jgi:hypothetical protein